jgi:hypothetical protein
VRSSRYSSCSARQRSDNRAVSRPETAIEECSHRNQDVVQKRFAAWSGIWMVAGNSIV